MSSNYYFLKWKTVLAQLRTLIQIDQEYQVSKAHDQLRCQAVERLNGMLAAYVNIYNEVLECFQQNLQVQKAKDIGGVLQAVVDRILELKQQLRKLEGCRAQFLSKGAIRQYLTVNDAEFHDIPFRVERDEHIQAMIMEAFNKAKEKINQRELELVKEEEIPEAESIDAWWEDNDDKKDDGEAGDKLMEYDEVEELSEEELKVKGFAALIQAHEKTRQVTQANLQRKQKREIWEKALLGTLKPQSRPELKIRAAKIIQLVARKHMELKRKKLRDCKTNEVLGIRQCGKTNYEERNKLEKVKDHRIEMFKQLNKDWNNEKGKIKEEFYKKRHDELREHYRDSIRDWFRDWYVKIGMFHNIPRMNDGGSVAIWRGDVPLPEDWYEQYKEYITAKGKNNKTTKQEAKLAKKAALMEQKKLKSEEKRKQKLEEALKRKIMKNPNMHPGYDYPESKKFQKLIETVENYHAMWNDMDEDQSFEVKQGNLVRLDEENVYAEVKLEIATQVDDDMKKELKKLNKALKKDYANAQEKLPPPMPEKKKKHGKKKKVPKAPDSQIVAQKIEYLAENGFLEEYPQTKLEDFIGDHNMTGDDCRCLDKEANPYAGELRSLWWEKCREVNHGFHRILIIGPAGSGRTTLVHAMASTNDATLLVLDPATLDVDVVTEEYLQNLMEALLICARGAQPAILYIRNVHLIYYKKTKKSIGSFPNAELIKRYLTRKLLKRFNKTDNVTVVASCVDPWLSTTKLLKQFPDVFLLPDTSYSVVVQLLNNWLASNRCLPRDLDVHSLARMLRGYGFAFLQETLQNFVTPDRIVKMAAHGVSVAEILDHFTETGVEKNDYAQYLNWYSKKTVWGKKEKKQLVEAQEFRVAIEKYAEVEKRKKQKKGALASEKES